MSLLMRLLEDLRNVNVPVDSEVNLEYDEKLYPYNDPKFGVELILEAHNMKVERYCKKIE